MKPCIPCYYKQQRLKAKLNALKERAIAYGKEQGYETVLVFQIPDEEEGEESRYGFAASLPAGAVAVELLRID